MFKNKILAMILLTQLIIFSECFSQTKIIKGIEFKGNENTSIDKLKSITQLNSGEEYNKSKTDKYHF
ncbi:MAG: hypothetical protein K2X69_07110 [Silvanigrellaceae bacterium]|nr:hypothetical protein [Silvanigrellaceae bacterium]